MGGILINSLGRRFVNELTTRDAVVRAMMQQPGGLVYLVLPHTAAVSYGLPSIQFYVSKGLFQQVRRGHVQKMGEGTTQQPSTVCACCAMCKAFGFARCRLVWKSLSKGGMDANT